MTTTQREMVARAEADLRAMQADARRMARTVRECRGCGDKFTPSHPWNWECGCESYLRDTADCD